MKKLPNVTTWASSLTPPVTCVKQLALDAGLNLGGDVLAGLRLHVDDVRVAFFDDRLVRHGQEGPALDDDLHDVVRGVLTPRRGQRGFYFYRRGH